MKHKSDVVILYDNANFVYDVMNSGKFIDQIK